ncbi:hypothetical protein HK102_003332 [Quaeritorhiza haematococci]|nr:hypothetical protein HK102_003332 [Quaeritorhiza haematococci]
MPPARNNIPRKPASPQSLFAQDIRPKVAAEHTDITYSKLCTIIAERWNSLSSEERAKYNIKAMEDKRRFDRELKAIKRRVGARASAA